MKRRYSAIAIAAQFLAKRSAVRQASAGTAGNALAPALAETLPYLDAGVA
jgi:hypothetical protein